MALGDGIRRNIATISEGQRTLILPYRLDRMTQQAKQMRLFFSGNASGDMELLTNSSSLGTTQLVNGAAFDHVGFQPTGDFELKFSSNMLDDLWIVVDWAAARLRLKCSAIAGTGNYDAGACTQPSPWSRVL